MNLKKFIASGLLLLAGLGIVGALHGCGQPVTPELAAAGYEAQQMRCVEQYAKKADIDACRMKIKAAWAFDAGGDQ